MCGQKCNGWRNYETWLANVWLTNGVEAGELLGEARRRPGKVIEQADWLRERVEELLDEIMICEAPFGEKGLFIDLLRSALEEIDWVEVVKTA